MPSRTLSNSARSNQKITSTPIDLAISSMIGAEIGAANRISRIRPKDLPHNRRQHNPRVDELQEGGVERQRERGGDAPTPEERCREQPRRLAFPPLKKPQEAERQYGEQARERECLKEHARDVPAHAPEQAEMDDGRKPQHRDQRRTDPNAYLPPTQRRAHE